MTNARRLSGFATSLLLCWVLAGCHRLAVDDAGPGSRQSGHDDPSRAAAGPAMAETGFVGSAAGCRLDYRLYRPEREAANGMVVLAHGFMRGRERMHGLARALAEAGIPTATIDFCNARPWDGGHLENGRDMVTLARRLGIRPVVYAGFSAGALAALVAAQEDPDSLGVVALDLVDDRGLGARIAAELDKPLIGLMGEPSACNARGSGMRIFSESRLGRAERVAGAGHCDFESPTSWLCELVCGRTEGSSALRRGIIESAVSAASELLRLEPGGT